MSESIPRKTLDKIRKLARIPQDIREDYLQCVNVTRLTSLKTLCDEPEMANGLALHLTRKTLERVEQEQKKSEEAIAHKEMMNEALSGMREWMENPSEENREHLRELWWQLKSEQNEYRRVKSNVVRIIRDKDLLVVEKALQCFLRPGEAGYWVYQTARDYAERYNSGHGTGLVPESIPLVEDIIEFFCDEYDLVPEYLTFVPQKKQAAEERSKSAKAEPTGKKSSTKTPSQKPSFTHRQGQFLAFIYLYTKLNRRAPAESDLQRYFGVTPPAVHGMVMKLAELGLITKEPGVARSIRINIPVEQIPTLDDVEGPML